MSPAAPIRLTLYDRETCEVSGEFTCVFVKWRYLKAALRLARLPAVHVGSLAELLAEVFGQRVSAREIERGATPEELVTVLAAIVARIKTLGGPGESAAAGTSEDPAIEPEPDEDPDGWLLDLEIQLVRAFDWSLKDLDDTDIESLLPFVRRLARGGYEEPGPGGQQVFCDQVNWL